MAHAHGLGLQRAGVVDVETQRYVQSLLASLFSDGWRAAVIIGPIAFVLAVLLSIKIAHGLRRLRLLRAAGMREVDRMAAADFADFLGVLFGRLDYNVEPVPRGDDFGAQLIVERDGLRIAMQARRDRLGVGIRAVQEITAARGFYGCEGAMIVTNGQFTDTARRLAERNHVVLWDRDQLARRMLEADGRAVDVPVSADQVTPVCCVCGRPVSEKVITYCRLHRQRFDGRIYCRNHQGHRSVGAPLEEVEPEVVEAQAG